MFVIIYKIFLSLCLIVSGVTIVFKGIDLGMPTLGRYQAKFQFLRPFQQ
jgi:hypothetical protein